MAITHLAFNDQTPHGRLLRLWLNGLEAALDEGQDIIALFPTMIDGDGSTAGQFNEVTSKFGFPDNATSLAAWSEIQSMMAKITVDSSVSSVNAAIKQVLAKFR